ncbi:MAG: FAD-dependent oxidoreductase, partial [Eubacteriales bacterium]|nr:FAD-dependent oxidoreductase [Eubacteriales bacterium]
MKDLLVIGGGPGGYVAAIRARQLGMKVALVEKDKLGGTCLNRGCIPTKTYYRHAEIMRSLQRLEEFSIQLDAGPARLDMAGTRARKDAVVEQMAGGVDALLQAHGVEVIRGEAVVEEAGRVRAGEQSIEAKRLLLATGSESIRPAALPGTDLPGVLTCEELLARSEIPARLLIIGGGVIGMEFAGIFKAFGSQVRVLKSLPRALAFLDKEIARRMSVLFKRQGKKINAGVKVERIKTQGDC